MASSPDALRRDGPPPAPLTKGDPVTSRVRPCVSAGRGGVPWFATRCARNLQIPNESQINESLFDVSYNKTRHWALRLYLRPRIDEGSNS